MSHIRGVSVAVAIGLFLITPTSAAADILLTPFAGFSRLYEENKGTFGVTFSFGSLIGFEFDAARIQLGSEDLPIADLDAHATTLMGNMVVRLPAGAVRPYGTAGVGLVRVTADVDTSVGDDVLSLEAQDIGWNIGAGVDIFLSPNFGIRTDFRRFRTGDVTFEDLLDFGGGVDELPLPDFNFWRTTFGVTLKF